MASSLEYAPAQKWHQRRKLRRAAIWVFILLALAVSAWLLGPTLYHKCRMLYYQSQCMNHVNPAGMTPVENAIRLSAPPPSPMPPEYDAIRQYVGDPQMDPVYLGRFLGKVLVHARKNAAGDRLVCAFLSEDVAPWGGSTWPRIKVFVVSPGTLTQPPKLIHYAAFSLETRISEFEAQPDPADDSVFIVTAILFDRPTRETMHLYYKLQNDDTIAERVSRP